MAHKKQLAPVTPTVESIAYRTLRKRIIDTPGAFVHEIGGIETHVHLAVSVPPSLTPSEWIGKLKGGSSYDVNQETRDKVLQWQAGYGIVSFGTKDLPWVIGYIQGQREHHAKGSIVDRLEQITQFDD